MSIKELKKLWQEYPASHLHCDITVAGPDSYRIDVSLIDSQGAVIARIDHYGSGDLDAVKGRAIERLVNQLQQVINP